MKIRKIILVLVMGLMPWMTACDKVDVQLNEIGTYRTGIFDKSAAEISAYDSETKRLFVAQGTANKLLILDIQNPAEPLKIGEVELSSYGQGVNSVAVKNGLVAVAVEVHSGGLNKVQEPGRVVFFNSDGDFLHQVTVGNMPDMVTFTPDGSRVLSANEGEPSEDYTVDPVGSISLVDLSGGVKNAVVTTLGFTAYNDTFIPGAHFPSPAGTTIAQDMEPEYITVSHDSRFAYVSLQENNALAVVDLKGKTISNVFGLGLKDHNLAGFGLDASNKDDMINIANWPVFGLYQPDSLAYFHKRGVRYVITANEGDSRIRPTADDLLPGVDEGDIFDEEKRVGKKSYPLDPVKFPNASSLKEDESLGRLKATLKMGDEDGDGDFDKIVSFGARSFSIWRHDRNGLSQVFDSGDDFEQITALQLPDFFNSTNDETDFDDRSDDKGPEPEAITVGRIRGADFAFIGLERVGGIMVYNVSNPKSPRFVQYVNNRDFNVDPSQDLDRAGDLAPEGFLFISAKNSPNGTPLLVVSNEVSGTVTLYSIEAK